jgi:hypothetical protein
MRKALTGVAACGLLLPPLAVWLVSAPACTPHTCDPSFETVWDPLDAGSLPNGFGHVLSTSPLVWESNDINEPWLAFPGQRTYQVWLPPQFVGDMPYELIPWIGAVADPAVDETPNTPGGNFAIAPGSLAQFSLVSSDVPLFASDGGVVHAAGFLITNATCAEYRLRIVVQSPGIDAGSASGPGGDDASSDGSDDGSSDGGSDAPADGPGDASLDTSGE